MALLSEEVGDVARVVNRPANLREYQDQLLHVAAVAVAALEQLGISDEPGCLGESNWGVSMQQARERRRHFRRQSNRQKNQLA